MASARPSPDPLVVLNKIAQCARDCMIKAAVEFGALTAGLCDPPDPRVAEASKTCIRSACTVREALSSQREIQTACGVEPTVVKTYIPVMSTLFGIATVAVAMRFANRYTVTGKFWWDDGFLALTWMGAVALTALTFEAKDHGFGSEMWAVDFEDMDHLLATAYASQLVFIVCRLMLRHSIILFYLRIFSIGSLRPLIIVGTMVFNTVFSLVIGLLLTFQCRPISFFWMQWDGNNLGKCISVDGLNFGGGAVGILTDVWVLLLPLPYVARLQLSLQKRVGVSFMLAAGVSVVTFTVLKVIAAKKISTSENTPTVMAEISLWTGLEIYAGIIAACLPGIRSFVTHFLHRVGLTSAPGSVVRSHQGHISLGHNAGSRSDNQKKNKTISSFQGSRSSQANIRITTMIHTQQHDGLPSDTYLPLHVMDGLNANNQTGVRAHAWA